MAMIDESGRSYVLDRMGAHTYIGDHVCVGDDEHVVIDLAQVEREGRRFLGVLVESGRTFCSGEFVRIGRATPLPPSARPRPEAARHCKAGDVVRVIATAQELLSAGRATSIIPHATYKVAMVGMMVGECVVELALTDAQRDDGRAWLPLRWVEHLHPRRLVPVQGEPGLVSCFGPRYPHVCPRCGAPAYVGLFSLECSQGFLCGRRGEPTPAIVEEVTFTNYPGKRTITTGAPAPGLEGAERIWRARDVNEYPGPESCLHPTREGAIAAWQARLAARKAAK